MNLSENLMILRKSYGYSQEELAIKLNVSRQSVSKWESGQSIPDLDRLIEIGKIFDITLDELVHGEDLRAISTDATLLKEEIRGAIRESLSYEYKSKAHIGNIPLLHINIGRGMRVAKGIIAIGNVAMGLVAIGGFAFGVLSFAALCTGVFAFGGLSLGVVAIGGAAVGYFAVGGLAVGIHAIGAASFAKEIAIGATSHGRVAIGRNVSGTHTLITTVNTTSTEIRNFILRHANAGIVRNIILFFI